MWPVSNKIRFLSPRERLGPPRSTRRLADRGEPNAEARARMLDRLRNGPSGVRERGRVDWSAVAIVGAVLAGVLVMFVVLLVMVRP